MNDIKISDVLAKFIARLLMSVVEGFGILYGMYFAFRTLGLIE